MKKLLIALTIIIAGVALAADVTISVSYTFKDNSIELSDGSITGTLDIAKSWLDTIDNDNAGSNYITRFKLRASQNLSNAVNRALVDWWRIQLNAKSEKDIKAYTQ